jgi:hypothetical protein
MALVLTVRDISAPDDVPLLVTGNPQIIDSLIRALTRKLSSRSGTKPSPVLLKNSFSKSNPDPDGREK